MDTTNDTNNKKTIVFRLQTWVFAVVIVLAAVGIIWYIADTMVLNANNPTQSPAGSQFQ
jgi:hypothetical protein